MVRTIVPNVDFNKLNEINFLHVNLALWRLKHSSDQCHCISVRNELRGCGSLTCKAYRFVNAGKYCSNRVSNLTGHDRSFDRSLAF